QSQGDRTSQHRTDKRPAAAAQQLLIGAEQQPVEARMLFAKARAQHRLDDDLAMLIAHEQILSLANEVFERADNLLLAEVVGIGHAGRSIGDDAASNGREKKTSGSVQVPGGLGTYAASGRFGATIAAG